MPSEYHCPLCHSKDIIEYENIIKCPNCGRKWYKDFIASIIPKENALSRAELHGLIDVFEEFKDEKTRKRFIKSIEEYLQE
ncbi:MAG: hypothetical protein ACFE9N_09540 [Promethearchaeota archaeon]